MSKGKINKTQVRYPEDIRTIVRLSKVQRGMLEILAEKEEVSISAMMRHLIETEYNK